MWIYAARRVLYAIPISLGVTILCFCLVYLAPGDPIQSLVGMDASAEQVAAVRAAYGLDQPLPLQYLSWLWRLLHGDLGTSIQTGTPVLTEILRALSNTLILAVGAVVIAFIIALAFGMLAAFNRGKIIDRLTTAISVAGVSIPNYWLAIVMVILFAVTWRVLPAAGMGTGGSATFNWLDWNELRFAILPMLAMAMVPLGVVMRSTRSAAAEVLSEDFVELLRAKGLSRFAIAVHVLRNALPQLLAVMGLQLGYLIGGSIMIETIFTWPGTGFLMNKAILTRDIPLLQGTVLVLALSFVIINLVVDILQSLIDPRVKRN